LAYLGNPGEYIILSFFHGNVYVALEAQLLSKEVVIYLEEIISAFKLFYVQVRLSLSLSRGNPAVKKAA
jgi:hypothetical protein